MLTVSTSKHLTSPPTPPDTLHPVIDWDAVREDLASYGHGVLRGWIKNGSIFARVRGLADIALGGAAELTQDPEAASELAGITVAVSLDCFHQKLKDGTGWHPQRGASMKSYFVGQCLLCFPNEYRRWLRECRAGFCPAIGAGGREALEVIDLPDDRPGPAQLAVLNSEVAELLRNAPERVRVALSYTAIGYSQREIASLFGTTPKGIEMLLRRYRVRHRSRQSPRMDS